MSSSSCLNNFLIRYPVSGHHIQGYDSGFRGQIAKSLGIVSKIALLVIASLAIANVCPMQLTSWSFIGLSVLSFTFYAAGSSEKRSTEAFLFEFIIQKVCLIIGILSLIGTLTQMQASIAMLSTVSGGAIIGGCFQKDYVKRLVTHSKNNESDLVLSEESFSKEMPILPIRILDKLIGTGRDVTFTTKTLLSSLTHKNNYSESVDLSNDSSALCVLIHGLKGRPAIFDEYHDEFESRIPKITIFQPHVKRKGICSLEEAAEGILKQTASWANAHPNKPIVFIGVSNGARIAGYITAKLKSEQKLQNPIRAHCIAGPFFGTKLVNQPDFPSRISSIWGEIFKKLYCDQVYDELSWGSACSQDIIQKMKDVSKDVTFNFYASFADSQIKSFISCLPNIPSSKHYFTSSEGHQSIVRAVKDRVIEDSMEFLQPQS